MRPAEAPSLYFWILLAQRLLVDLSNARFRDLLHEENFVGYPVFRDHAPIGMELHMRLNVVFVGLGACLRIADDNRQRPLSPFLVSDANHRDFGYAAVLRDDVLEFE